MEAGGRPQSVKSLTYSVRGGISSSLVLRMIVQAHGLNVHSAASVWATEEAC